MLQNARLFFEERCRDHQQDRKQITFEDFTQLKQAYEDAISTKENQSTITAKQCPTCQLYYVGGRCQACEVNDR
jgi:hypothetical protein